MTGMGRSEKKEVRFPLFCAFLQGIKRKKKIKVLKNWISVFLSLCFQICSHDITPLSRGENKSKKQKERN